MARSRLCKEQRRLVGAMAENTVTFLSIYSLLGGLLHIDDTMIRYDVSWVYDMNDMTNPGYYSLNKDETKGKNYPPDLKYGGLVVFAVRGGVWILQIAFSVYGLVYSRTRTENVNSWSEWSRL